MNMTQNNGKVYSFEVWECPTCGYLIHGMYRRELLKKRETYHKADCPTCGTSNREFVCKLYSRKVSNASQKQHAPTPGQIQIALERLWASEGAA